MAGPAAFLDLLARAELRSAAADWAEAAGLWGLVTAANYDMDAASTSLERHERGIHALQSGAGRARAAG